MNPGSMNQMASILIVDDERSIRITLSRFLEGDGHDVSVAGNVEEARALLGERYYEVILTDIIMPKITGVELLRELSVEAPDSLVIMMTGEPTVDTATESVRLGATDYLVKPISKESVLHAVRNAVKVSRLNAEKARLEAQNRIYQKDQECLIAARPEDLVASEARYRTIFNSGPASLVVVDNDGFIIDINEYHLVNVTKGSRTREDYIGQRIWEYPPIVSTGQADAYRQIVNGEPVEIGVVFIPATSGGFSGHFRVSSVPLFKDGQLAGAIVTHQEISERKQSELVSAEPATRSETFRVAAPDIIMEVNTDQVYTWANQAGIDFFGVDVLGKTAESYFIGEQDICEQIGPLFAGEEDIFNLESWQRRCDGESRLLAWWCRVLKDTAGNVTGAKSTARDITADRQAVSELKASEERFRSLLDSTAEGIYGRDLEGNCNFANSACIRLLGYSSVDELLGRNMHELIHHSHPDGSPYPETECLMSRTDQRTQGTHSDTEVLWRKDGTSFPVEYWSYPVRKAGELTGAVLTFIDISERRDAEFKLRALSSELVLAEERERRRLAVQLHDGLGHSMVLARLKLEDLRRAMVDSRAVTQLDEVISIIERSVADMRSMTFEISPPVLHEVGLGAALAWLVEDGQSRHGIQMHFIQQAFLEQIPDETNILLFQATRELLFNVVKHAQASRVDVRLAVEDEMVVIEVADDGCGFIPVAVEQSGGHPAGFGLFSIRERMKFMAGKFSIQSTPDQGTVITMRVPMNPASDMIASGEVLPPP